MPARGRPARHPADLTGKEDDRLRRENAQAIEEAGANMALAGAAPSRRKRTKEVHDYTDAARPKVSPLPAEPPAAPREHVVRLVASIEKMTFGKDIIDPGDFSDPGHPRMPMVGPLKNYDFTEGVLYRVDEPLYQHLKELGYLHEEDEDE